MTHPHLLPDVENLRGLLYLVIDEVIEMDELLQSIPNVPMATSLVHGIPLPTWDSIEVVQNSTVRKLYFLKPLYVVKEI